MVLKFFIDPATGVVRPPVTVFNGGAKKRKQKKTRKSARKGRRVTRRRR